MTLVCRRLRTSDGPEAEMIAALGFPHLAGEHRLHAEDVAEHVALFPDGAVAVAERDRLLGYALGWRMDFDLEHPRHTLDDVAGADHHDPDGDWYYGLDIAVHPEARGRGIGSHLYRMRKALVRRLGCRGIIAGGMIPGYRAVQHELTPTQYVEEVVRGRRKDPTLSFQLSQGFEVRGLLPGYVDGTAGRGVATLLVWEA